MHTKNTAKTPHNVMCTHSDDIAAAVVGIAAFALGVWMVIDIAAMADNPIASMSGGIDAKQYPMWLGITLMSLSVIIVGKAIFRLLMKSGQSDVQLPWIRITYVIMALFLYILAFNPLGYIVSTTLFGVVLMLAGGARKSLSILVFPLVLTVALYWIVRIVFDIYLPSGWMLFSWVGG